MKITEKLIDPIREARYPGVENCTRVSVLFKCKNDNGCPPNAEDSRCIYHMGITNKKALRWCLFCGDRSMSASRAFPAFIAG